MNTEFRVGDIVGHRAGIPEEGRVVRVLDNFVEVQWDWGISSWRPWTLHLIRRPVEVGDVLRIRSISEPPPAMLNKELVDQSLVPSVEALAIALWLEDGEVERHIEDRYDIALNGRVNPKRLEDARVIAWKRDDLGKRSKWTDVAEAVVERLSGWR